MPKFRTVLNSGLLALFLLPAMSARSQALAPVELAVARHAPLVEELKLTGSLTAPRSSRLAPAVEGRIARIAVDAGDRVSAGDVMVALDDELARLELDQARAAEREAAARLAEAERRVAEARELALRQSFARTEVLSREADVARTRADLDRLRAVSAYDEALLDRHTLRAPFDGVVSLREADLGEWVTPDSPVLTLVAVDRLWLDLRVPQGYFGRIDEDVAMQFGVDALAGARFDAAISDIVPVSDPTTRTFLVRARIDNRDGRMTPGMSARATLRLATGREGVQIPRDALVRYPDGRSVVWVALGEGERRQVEEVRVATGLASARSVEIREGVAAGAEVVVRGNESLRQGQEVRVGAVR